MPSRMERYFTNPDSNGKASRTSRNEELYENLYSNRRYTELTELEKDNIFEIDNSNSQPITKRRSDYNHKVSNMFGEDNRYSDDDKVEYSSYQRLFNEDAKEKNYNVNDIMELAKKNRKIENEDERIKRLKSMEYSILSDLSQEKVKEYRDKKQKGITREEEENLEELINTITSKKIREEIDSELFDDLMPDEQHQTLVSDELLEELKDYESEITNKEVEENTQETGIDKSFYTRSMDLKKEDLVFDDDSASEEELENLFDDDKSGRIGRIITILLLVVIVIGIIGFIVYNFL